MMFKDESAPQELDLLHTVPLTLAMLHRELNVAAITKLSIQGEPDQLNLIHAIISGAGFGIISQCQRVDAPNIEFELEREHTLSDTVGPDMRLLICGLNPSPASAMSGIGFHRPGNRFWPAMIAAGLVDKDRDPLHALKEHGVGMTDLVKRTTAKASQVGKDEFIHGLERLKLKVAWLKPATICFVGLAGWRAAIDPRAKAGWQDSTPFDSKTYLMPSTSGLNASSSLDDLTNHLKIVSAAIACSNKNS